MMKKILAWVLFVSAIVGVITSYPFSVIGQPVGVWITELIVMFSFFTVQSNILVALCAFAIINEDKPRQHPALSFWSKTPTVSAVTLYIIITGTIHYSLLRGNGPGYQGWHQLANLLHHYVNPLLMPILWAIHRKAAQLRIIHTVYWLSFPFAYLFYWLIRGAIINYYPYFFIDVNYLGYKMVLLNSLGLTVIFWILGMLIIGLNKALPLKQ